MKVYTVTSQNQDWIEGYYSTIRRTILSYHATKELAENKIRFYLEEEIAKLVEEAKTATHQKYIIVRDDLLSRNKIQIENDSFDPYNDGAVQYSEYDRYFITEIEVEE